MRIITGHLTSRFYDESINKDNLLENDGILVNSFIELFEEIAKLSYRNRDYLLFFRGQPEDCKSKTNKTTLYPSIYRDRISTNELNFRFNLLETVENELIENYKLSGLEGIKDIKSRKYIRWSIIQHYEICKTPLLDITQSLKVACSFAQLSKKHDKAYIYVLGLPFITNSISINSEHDLVNIRLLSIAPPSALRAYYQEGFLIGTDEITTDYNQKKDLDFNRRIIAKFAIPTKSSTFWTKGFTEIPEECLYPKNDKIFDLCDKIKEDRKKIASDKNISIFLNEWKLFEENTMQYATKFDSGLTDLSKAIEILFFKNIISEINLKEIKDVRAYRNMLANKRMNDNEILFDRLKYNISFLRNITNSFLFTIK